MAPRIAHARLTRVPDGRLWVTTLNTNKDCAIGGTGGCGLWTVFFSLAFDSTTNAVYVGGETGGALDGFQRIGLIDLVVLKYDKDGVKQWQDTQGTASQDKMVKGRAIAARDRKAPQSPQHL